MSNEWIQKLNEESMEDVVQEDLKNMEQENNFEYQCAQETVNGRICKFLKELSEKSNTPILVDFEWNGVVSRFTFNGDTVGMQTGRWLDGSLRLTINKSELDKHQWWNDALFNNPNLKFSPQTLDISDDFENIAKNDKSEEGKKTMEGGREKIDLLVDGMQTKTKKIV